MRPLWTHSQRPWRNGWQLVCWTAVPVEARMWARNSGEETWPARSGGLRGRQGGPERAIDPGGPPGPIPAGAESVAVGGRGSQPSVHALVDEGVGRLVEQ